MITDGTAVDAMCPGLAGGLADSLVLAGRFAGLQAVSPGCWRCSRWLPRLSRSLHEFQGLIGVATPDGAAESDGVTATGGPCARTAL